VLERRHDARIEQLARRGDNLSGHVAGEGAPGHHGPGTRHVGDRREVHVHARGGELLRRVGKRDLPDGAALLVGHDERIAAGRALNRAGQAPRAARVRDVRAEEDGADRLAGPQAALHVTGQRRPFEARDEQGAELLAQRRGRRRALRRRIVVSAAASGRGAEDGER
jgi:hypothetical protein